MEAYASSMYLKLYYLELAGGCKVLRTRCARGKKGELGSRNEPNGRKTDGRTDEMFGRQIGRKFGSDGKNRLVQMVRLL